MSQKSFLLGFLVDDFPDLDKETFWEKLNLDLADYKQALALHYNGKLQELKEFLNL